MFTPDNYVIKQRKTWAREVGYEETYIDSVYHAAVIVRSACRIGCRDV